MKHIIVLAIFGIISLGCVKRAEAQEPQAETTNASTETVAAADSLPASRGDKNWCEDHPVVCSVMISTIVPLCPFVLDDGTIVDCFPPETFGELDGIYW